MTLDLCVEYKLTLTVEEMRLVEKALGGRLKPEEAGAAAELGNQFAAMRLKKEQDRAKSYGKLEANLREAGAIP